MVEIAASDVPFLGKRTDAPHGTDNPESDPRSATDTVTPDEIPF